MAGAGTRGRARAKADDAFRTIREVSDWLEVPTHVLRFWESKFPQVSPVKGAGGRRYYRPDDMLLLGGLQAILHEQGVTVRAAQARLKEEGAEAIAALSRPLPGAEEAADPVAEVAAAEPEAAPARPSPMFQPVPQPAQPDEPGDAHADAPDAVPQPTDATPETVPPQPEPVAAPAPPASVAGDDLLPGRAILALLAEGRARRLAPDALRRLKRLRRRIGALADAVEEELAEAG